MNVNNILGLKPIVFSLRSALNIETVHSKISDAVDLQFKMFNRDKSKYFYGRILDNQFDIKMYTDHRNSFKARVIILLDKIDYGTKINIKFEFESIILNFLLFFMLFGLLILIGGFVGWIRESETKIMMAFGAVFIGFSWLIAKMGYMLSIDQTKSSLTKIFRTLEIK